MKDFTLKEIFGDKVCNHNMFGEVGDKNIQSFCSIQSYIDLQMQEINIAKNHLNYLIELKNKNPNIKIPAWIIKDEFNSGRRHPIETIEIETRNWITFYEDAKNKGYKIEVVDIQKNAFTEKEKRYSFTDSWKKRYQNVLKKIQSVFK